MIYLVGLIVGILNGLFASGSGQVLVFYLIFIKHLETHKVRALSVSILSIASIFAIIGYTSMIHFEIPKVIFLAIIAVITGVIGTRVMKKISADWLNLISGLLIVGLTLYKIFFKG